MLIICFSVYLSSYVVYCALHAGTKMFRQHSSVLYLEDGSSFTGYGFGAAKDVSGEVGMWLLLLLSLVIILCQ